MTRSQKRAWRQQYLDKCVNCVSFREEINIVTKLMLYTEGNVEQMNMRGKGKKKEKNMTLNALNSRVKIVAYTSLGSRKCRSNNIVQVENNAQCQQIIYFEEFKMQKPGAKPTHKAWWENLFESKA